MRIVAILFGIILSANLYGSEFRAGDDVVIPAGDTLRDDLFCGGQRIEVLGVIDGDLVGGARKINVSGEVTGDFIAGAEFIVVGGTVHDDVRLAGRQIDLMGRVGSDAICFCQDLDLAEGSIIAGDLTLYAQDVRAGGLITGDLVGGVEDAAIAGTIEGDVELSADELVIHSSAEIMGDLTYTSPVAATIHESSIVHGTITHREKEVCEAESKMPWLDEVMEALNVLKWVFLIIMLAGLLITGLVLVAVARRFTDQAHEAIKTSPWVCLGLGILIAIVVPLAIAVLAVTVVGLPLAMIVCALYFVCKCLSPIIFGIFLGKGIFRLFRHDLSPYLAVIVGLLVMFFVFLIPFAGPVIVFIAWLFGLGATVRTAYRMRKGTK